VNYTNAIEVWTCQLDGLAEYAFLLPCHRVFHSHCATASLATETEHVRQRLADYTNDLLSLGVDGLRLDAAKRMSQISSNQGSSDPSDMHRHQTRRYRQYLVEIDKRTIYHSGGATLVLEVIDF
jgi:glycosidase